MDIAKLVHKVLSQEQRFLVNRDSWNIRKYEEKWIQFLVFRRLLNEKRFEHVEAEHPGSGAFVDIIADRGKAHGVALELKGPAKVNSAGARDRLNKQIQRDARKLRKIRSLGPGAKCVLALAYGRDNQVQKWLEGAPRVCRQRSGRKWTLTGNNLKCIPLGVGEVLGLVCFRIT
jgi:hypothetical protein